MAPVTGLPDVSTSRHHHRLRRVGGVALALLAAAAVLVGPARPSPAGAAQRQAARTTTTGPALPRMWQVSAGAQYTCGIGDGALSCWGRNTWGQVGNGRRGGAVASPTRVGTASDWVQVSAGGSTTCGIRAGGRLYCWGLNNRGQVGDGTRTLRLTPKRVRGSGWSSVDAGWYHVCAIKGGTHALYCWGDNTYGELGQGNHRESLGRHRVPGRWRVVRAEGWTSCGIRTNGSLWCWGRNLLGQVGDGTWADQSSPTRVAAGGRWADVSLSWTHACARRKNGSAWCWGSNDLGALGDGTTTARNRPVAVLGGHRARAVSAYEGGSCLADDSDHLWCWGDNRYGQGSNGAPASGSPITQPVRRSGSFVRLSGGWMHECGTQKGTVHCWGSNDHDQLATAAPAARPVAIRASATNARGRSPLGLRGRASSALHFRMASYNLLVDYRTSPYRVDDEWAPGRLRGEWEARYLGNRRIDVAGIQEGGDGNLSALLTASGSKYGAFPDPRAGQYSESSVIWDRSRFALVESHLIRTMLNNKRLPRPYVLLRDKSTGRRFWVMDVHNPAAYRQEQRDAAMRVQLAKIRALEKTGYPVFYIGDFNEGARADCQVMQGSGLVAAQGGHLTASGTCVPPKDRRIDWIFGSRSVHWSGFGYSDLPLVRLSTDHHVPQVDVTIP